MTDIFFYIAHFLDSIINITLLYSMFKYLLYYKMKPLRYAGFYIIICQILTWTSYAIGGNSPLLWTVGLLGPIVCSTLLIETKHHGAILYSILGICIIGSLESIIGNIVKMLPLTPDALIDTKAMAVVGEVITLVMWLLVCLKLHNYYINEHHNISSRFFIFLSLSITFSFSLYCFSTDWITKEGYDKLNYDEPVVRWLLALSGVAVLLQWIFTIFLYLEKTKMNIANETLKTYMEIEKRHFNEARIKDDNIRRFRHDIKGHIAVLKQYSEENETEKIYNYLSKLNEEFSNAKLKYNTGNIVIDGILNQKCEKLESENITLDIDGEFNKLNNIEDFSVCTIFQNALQNAIEACSKLQDIKRSIKIKCFTQGNIIGIKFSNPVDTPIKIKHNHVKTSKSDNINHGLGLRQIERIVEELEGNMQIKCEDNTFSLEIRI